MPQGVIGLFTRFGMDVSPGAIRRVFADAGRDGEGREVRGFIAAGLPSAAAMEEAFDGADSSTPRAGRRSPSWKSARPSWKPETARSSTELEKRCLKNNARFKDWECTEELMARTKRRPVHALPARRYHGGELRAGRGFGGGVRKFRTPLYRQAGWKPTSSPP